MLKEEWGSSQRHGQCVVLAGAGQESQRRLCRCEAQPPSLRAVAVTTHLPRSHLSPSEQRYMLRSIRDGQYGSLLSLPSYHRQPKLNAHTRIGTYCACANSRCGCPTMPMPVRSDNHGDDQRDQHSLCIPRRPDLADMMSKVPTCSILLDGGCWMPFPFSLGVDGDE